MVRVWRPRRLRFFLRTRHLAPPRDYSEATAEEIDREVRTLLDEAYQRAKQILTANRDKLDVIAKALLEFEDPRRLANRRQSSSNGRMLKPAHRGSPRAAAKKMEPEKTAQTSRRRPRRHSSASPAPSAAPPRKPLLLSSSFGVGCSVFRCFRACSRWSPVFSPRVARGVIACWQRCVGEGVSPSRDFSSAITS